MSERVLIILERVKGGRTREVGVFGYVSPAKGTFTTPEGDVVTFEGYDVVRDDSNGARPLFVA